MIYEKFFFLKNVRITPNFFFTLKYIKRLNTVPKNPLGLGILGKPPGDYSNGRDLTLTVRGYSLAIMSASIEAASLTLGKINPIVRGICLTLRQLHKKITLKLEYIP